MQLVSALSALFAAASLIRSPERAASHRVSDVAALGNGTNVGRGNKRVTGELCPWDTKKKKGKEREKKGDVELKKKDDGISRNESFSEKGWGGSWRSKRGHV